MHRRNISADNTHDLLLKLDLERFLPAARPALLFTQPPLELLK